MKPLWTLSILLSLLVALGCSKDEETTKTEGDGDDQAMGPDGGEDMGLGGEGDPGGLEGGAPMKPKQPAVDPNAPAGKQLLWTYGSGQKDIAKYVGQTDIILAAAFGQPASWKKQGSYVVYTYDKMRVKGAQNMQYSKVHFVVKPDNKLGGGKVVQVQLDPASGVKMQPAGGLGGEGFPGGGESGEGFEGGGTEGIPAGGVLGEPTPR